jgi:hypothetical protein
MSTPIIPVRSEIIEESDLLRILLSNTNYTILIDTMLTNDPSITFDIILNMWDSISPIARNYYHRRYTKYHIKDTDEIHYEQSLKYLLQKLSEKESVTLEIVNKLITIKVPYEIFKIVLKQIKMSPTEKMDMIISVTQREYQEEDIKIISSNKALIFKYPIHRHKIMLWLLDNSDKPGMITSAKMLYDMAEASQRFEYFKKCCKLCKSINNSCLLEHMLNISTPEELPNARDILLEDDADLNGWGARVYSILLRQYTKSI